MLDFQAARYLVQGEVAKQAGNNHPTSIPTGVFKTKRRLHQHRRHRPENLGAVLRARSTRPRCCTSRNIRPAPARSKNRDALNAEIDSLPGKAAPAPTGSSASTRPACRAGRSIRSTRCSPIRRCKHLGMAQSVDQEGQEQDAARRPAGVAVAHAVAPGGAAAGARRAHRRGAQGVRLLSARDIAALHKAKARSGGQERITERSIE